MTLLLDRLGGDGLYLLDEPEAALSPSRQLAVLARLHQLIRARSQFVIATHSPILMAYPDAIMYQLSEDGIKRVKYEDTEHYVVTPALPRGSGQHDAESFRGRSVGACGNVSLGLRGSARVGFVPFLRPGQTMEFFSADADYRDLAEAWARYRSHLDAIRHQIPPGAYDFATAPWHYDPADHRSLHDAWVEKVLVSEEATPEKQGKRKLRIVVRLVGAYHDGHHELSYSGVTAYQLGLASGGPDSLSRGHGDWLFDEVRLSESGNVLHEIVFSSGAQWTIECASLEHSMTIPPLRD